MKEFSKKKSKFTNLATGSVVLDKYQKFGYINKKRENSSKLLIFILYFFLRENIKSKGSLMIQTTSETLLLI